jgi:di/tricarboxylate transporter
MNPDLLAVLSLLAAAIAMFARNKPRTHAVALIMMAVLPLTGVITMSEALAGFSDPNIVLIAALFVIGEGLARTGVAQRLGDWLVARAGTSEPRMVVLLMGAVGSLGAAMSSTGVVAIFIPIVPHVGILARHRASPHRARGAGRTQPGRRAHGCPARGQDALRRLSRSLSDSW